MQLYFHSLDAKARDRSEPLYLFIEPRKKHQYGARARYRSCECRKCGSFDLLEAVALGIDESVRGPTSVIDVLYSDDNHLIVSERGRDALASIPVVRLSFAAFPSDSRYFVMVPGTVIGLPEEIPFRRPGDTSATAPFHRIHERCRECNRYTDVSYDARHFRVPRDTELSGLILPRGNRGSPVCWIVSAQVANLLVKTNISGLRIVRNEFVSE